MRTLADHAARLGVPLDATALDRFARYRDLLLAANRQFNLTRITDPADLETRFFAESLALLPAFPERATSLLDVGSGGGAPGLPLAIARPDLPVVLLDATSKKVRFLQETADALGLTNVLAIHGRAETLARDPAHRERHAVVTARAVARLVTLVELTLPFLAVGGRAILPKGAAACAELDEALHAIRALGGAALDPHPLAGGETTVILIDKRAPTPAAYPRADGVPNSKPLLNP